MNKTNTDILVLGIGNILMKDEGVGVHAIKYMESREMPENTKLLDGGTGGFHILSILQEYSKIIMIDATLDKQKEGSLKVIEPKFSSDFPKALSSHDIGLKDLIESSILLDTFPKIYLITVSIVDIQTLDLNLSDNIKKVLPDIYKLVLDIFNKIMNTR